MTRRYDCSSAELARARAALVGGGNYVARQASWGHRATTTSLVRTRMLGNQLRELDRLLSIWLDALDSTLNLGDPEFWRLHNTPNKLYLMEMRLGSETTAHLRLRAIGRISACLYHCRGQIHDSRIHNDVAIAHGPGRANRHVRKVESDDRAMLHLEPGTLAGIGLFYLDIEKSVSARPW